MACSRVNFGNMEMRLVTAFFRNACNFLSLGGQMGLDHVVSERRVFGAPWSFLVALRVCLCQAGGPNYVNLSIRSAQLLKLAPEMRSYALGLKSEERVYKNCIELNFILIFFFFCFCMCVCWEKYNLVTSWNYFCDKAYDALVTGRMRS
jgi:hypothetical protein